MKRALLLLALLALSGCRLGELLTPKRNLVWACTSWVVFSIDGRSSRSCAREGWVPKVDTIPAPPPKSVP